MDNTIEFNFSATINGTNMELEFDANSKRSNRVVKLHADNNFNGKVLIIALKLKLQSNNVLGNRFWTKDVNWKASRLQNKAKTLYV